MGRLFTEQRCEVCGKLNCENQRFREKIRHIKAKLKEFNFAIDGGKDE